MRKIKPINMNKKLSLINTSYEKHLSENEKKIIQISQLLEGIYWTKNYLFINGAKAFYSDQINDYYWTLVQQIIPKSENELTKLSQEAELFFSKLSKQFSFYLFPNEQKRGIAKVLQKLGYKTVIQDQWMSLNLKNYQFIENKQKDIFIKEVENDSENELYVQTYTHAYNSNPNDEYYGYGEEGIYEKIYQSTWKDLNIRKKFKRFIAYYKNQPACCGALYYLGNNCYLSEIGTDAKYRQKGLARALSHNCFKTGVQLNCSTCYLITEKGSAAQNLYHSLGFKPIFKAIGMSKS
jgi:ribosomal protein S18 acetylase RimI-like enzyme